MQCRNAVISRSLLFLFVCVCVCRVVRVSVCVCARWDFILSLPCKICFFFLFNPLPLLPFAIFFVLFHAPLSICFISVISILISLLHFFLYLVCGRVRLIYIYIYTYYNIIIFFSLLRVSWRQMKRKKKLWDYLLAYFFFFIFLLLFFSHSLFSSLTKKKKEKVKGKKQNDTNRYSQRAVPTFFFFFF